MNQPRPCPYCNNGRISVDGGSLCYRCPDCEGTGTLWDPEDLEPEEEEELIEDEPKQSPPTKTQ